jgi:septum site-determining protein MinD
MARLISVIGGKGGVGKTTLVANLASALTEIGKDVIAVDGNLTTPNLGLHLGLHLVPNNLHSVLKGDSDLSDSIYYHPSGFKILPASMNVNDLSGVDVGKLPEVTLNLPKESDFVLMDCAAGLGREAILAIQASNEVLLITNPQMPAVADTLKTLKIAESSEKKVLGVIVNRVGRKWHELTSWEIEDILKVPVLAEIPEDENVAKATTLKTPLVEFNPHSPASVEIRRLAHWLTGREFIYEKPKPGILQRFVNWLTT